jgi:hypothetical protein
MMGILYVLTGHTYRKTTMEIINKAKKGKLPNCLKNTTNCIFI